MQLNYLWVSKELLKKMQYVYTEFLESAILRKQFTKTKMRLLFT